MYLLRFFAYFCVFFLFSYQVLLADATFAFIFVTAFTGIPGCDVSTTAAAGFSLFILGKMKSGSKK
jgi:hypothetical protein